MSLSTAELTAILLLKIKLKREKFRNLFSREEGTETVRHNVQDSPLPTLMS